MAQRVKMPDDNIWPPKPTLPDPLTEYDDVIAAKLAALSETKTGPNKLRLIKALRNEEGMDLSQAYALVTSYCDRHGLFVTSKAAMTFSLGGCGLALAALCLAVFSAYLMLVRRDAVLSQPHHHAALIALYRQEMGVLAAFLLLIAMSLTISTTLIRSRRRKR